MDINEVIKEQIEGNTILLYMKGSPNAPQCGFSARVVSMLNTLVEDYATRNVLEDPQLREGIKEYSSWPTIPQLYVDREFLGGCDIITEMYEKGELQPMVDKAGVEAGADQPSE